MEFVGYARVSSTDQDWRIQVDALKAAGCTTIFTEKKSGTSLKERIAFNECMTYLRKKDTLVVTRIDRLTRSILDLQNLLVKLREKQVHLKATEQPVDTGSASGKAFLDMLGVFAEFETNLRRERQLEGVARAKKEGKYKGRQPTAQAKSQEVIQLYKKGIARQAIADQLKIGIASVFRILKKYKLENPSINTALPPTTTQKKIAQVNIWLHVENNSKFVRGKGESRQEIERQCFSEFNMVKKHKDSNEYTLQIPYETDTELDETIHEIMSEASYIADLRNGFVEIDALEPATEKTW